MKVSNVITSAIAAALLLAGCAATQPLPSGISAMPIMSLAPVTVDVTVDWTCTGAHGSVGIAAEQDMRIIDMTATGMDSADVSVNLNTNWFGMPWVPNIPDPVEAGTVQEFTFSSYLPGPTLLLPGHTYAIAMKARNDNTPPQWGALGNIHIFTTPEPTGPPGTIDNLRVKVQVIVEVDVP